MSIVNWESVVSRVLGDFGSPNLSTEMHWKRLRRSGTHVHLTYGATFSNNLIGTDFEWRTEPNFELRFNLDRNLRSSKSSNEYADARDLADGAIHGLEMIQLDEHQIISGITEALRAIPKPSSTWVVTITLEGRDFHFCAKPERDSASIFLYIVSEEPGSGETLHGSTS